MQYKLSEIEPKEIMPGYYGKLVHTQNTSLAFWEVEEGAQVPEHSHMNEQIMHVIEGEFEFTLDGTTKVYHPVDITGLDCARPDRSNSTYTLLASD